MPVIGFGKFVGFRAREEELEDIKFVVKKKREKYFNQSHFVRCAVSKLLREELQQEVRT